MKKRRVSRSVSTAHHMPAQPVQLSVPQPADHSRSVVVIAVALTMIISVVGTFIVLNELSTVERSIDALQAHRALNAMLVKEQQARAPAPVWYPPKNPQVTEFTGEVSVTILGEDKEA
ncbi:hypothetical protein HY490_05285 [Candidatus Woesearchaeota archaeon]|nr:hypothetical protein [Candidatus Woesearchaeota archaeon]